MPLSSYQQIQQVKDHYNTIGLHFSETRKKPMWAEILPFIKEVKPEMKVLDVGCGNGRLLTAIKGRKFKYLGIDFSKLLLEQAKIRFPKRRFLLRDITNLDDWKHLGTYDVVFCLGVLHHIADRKKQHEVLQQIFLHTKPGGKVIFSVWNLWQYRFWKYHFWQIKRKLEYNNFSFVWIPYSSQIKSKPGAKTIWRFCKAYFPGEFISLVKQVGFEVDTYYYASKGETYMSIFTGQNFCLMARKKI